MTTEAWLALFALLSSGGAAFWMVAKVIIPKYVAARIAEARDRLDHHQAMEEAEVKGLSSQRDADQRLTLTLNQNLIGTLERSMAEATTANDALRERFFVRPDGGLTHIYSELDGIRLEMRRMDANYGDLAKDRHLLEAENHRQLEDRIDRMAAVIGRLVLFLETTHHVKLESRGLSNDSSN